MKAATWTPCTVLGCILLVLDKQGFYVKPRGLPLTRNQVFPLTRNRNSCCLLGALGLQSGVGCLAQKRGTVFQFNE